MAISCIKAAQLQGGGWRYQKETDTGDVSVTGWSLMALAAGQRAGIPFDSVAIKRGWAFIDSLTDLETGRIGSPTTARGLESQQRLTQSAVTENLTAIGICSRIFPQNPTAWSDLAAESAVAKKPPVWDEARGSIEMESWYFGTRALFHLRSDALEAWDSWYESLQSAVIPHQSDAGCARGSWDPKGVWADAGGRVYATALMTLCLEVPSPKRRR